MRPLISYLRNLLLLQLKRSKNKSISIQKNVKLNKRTKIEDHVKIYSNTSIYSSHIGRGTYIAWNCILNKVNIGRFCSIAPDVQIVYGKHPVNEFISTHPCFYSNQKQAGFSFVTDTEFTEYTLANESCFSVEIGNDVWIGQGVRIMEGVTIGDGSIIGANSLVTKNVEPYSINVGSPSRCLRMRFEQSLIQRLLDLEWWNFSYKFIETNAVLFSKPHSFLDELERVSND
ncbi:MULTISPECIES: CatB-related O-acetyltransferase [unclassified Pseudoalteromonas]|uniref:CatB-related O-acetyltransferase n=1 Tax=unclassified Pseudoalteromonas TaxID=194690 RepID=UPI0004B136F9|nr:MULTISPECIES: CatB-related O-acetyltransferase [unclassified Pseudoalteromonas]